MNFNLDILKNFSLSFKTNYLVGMNVPAYSARRDASYDGAVSILTSDLMVLDREARLQRYATALRFLEESRDSMHIAPFDAMKKSSELYEQYLVLLIDTVQAVSSLLNHELILLLEEKEMEGFIGNRYSDQSKVAAEIFSKSETEILKNIVELVKIAHSPIMTLRENFVRKFSQEDLERYRKAEKEFCRAYSETPPSSQGGPK